MSSAAFELLFTVALTAIVLRSYLRYFQPPAASPTRLKAFLRPVILVIGGLLCASFVYECFRQLRALLN